MTAATATRDTREDAVRALLEDLNAGVAELTTGADWLAYLDIARRFHRYSFRNTLAIALQRPDATRVAGYRRWQELGRQVRRGEQGIRILAPVTYRAAADNHPAATPEAVTPSNSEAEAAARVLRGFKVARVFDINQTDGDPLPEPPVHVLDGNAPAGLRDQLAAVIRAKGFTYTLGALAGHPGAFGVTHHLARTVIIRDDLRPAQQAKTTAHELAHVLLHSHDRGEDFDRARAEIEAESVAYLVCGAHGLATGAYSFGYVATWSGGDPDIVRSTGERVLGCARQILDRLGLKDTPAA